jgi:tetratricopeptide (TPR) repeat protein
LSHNLAMERPTANPAHTLGALALGRLRSRLLSADLAAGNGFLDEHRAALCRLLGHAVRRALLVLEVALQETALPERIAALLIGEDADLVQSQAYRLRVAFLDAGLGEDDPAEIAAAAQSLKRLRRSGDGGDFRHEKIGEVAASLPERDEGSFIVGLLEALELANEAALARVVACSSRYGDLLLVGLVDYFLCRALFADPMIGPEFVYVHVDQPAELWKDDLELLTRLVEQHADTAVSLLDGVVSPPRDADDEALEVHSERALAYYRAADYEQAVAEFTVALRYDPTNFPLYAYRGDAYRLLCDYDGALADYDEALRLNPASANVLVQRATVHRLKGELRQAVRDTSAAIDLDSTCASAFLGRADAYSASAMLQEAIDDYTVAIKLQPQHLWAYFGRAEVHLRTEAYDASIGDYNRVLALNPHFVLALLHRGDARCQKGDFGLAILDYTKVLREHPRNQLAYRGRAKAQELRGDLDQAISDYGRALRLVPNDANVLCSRGTVLRRKGNLKQALQDLNEAVRCSSDGESAFYNRGLIFLAQGLFAKALADFNVALDRNPSLVAGYLGRALVHDRLGQFSEAIQNCGKALQIDQESAPALLLRGVISSHAGRYEKALIDLNKAIGLDPLFPPAYLERGMAKMFAGQHAEAIADFSHLIDIDPGQAIAYALRGSLRQVSGELDTALADFSHAFKLDPGSVLANCHQSLTDEARNRSTQLLVDYVEGVQPKPPAVKAEERVPRPKTKDVNTTQHAMQALVDEKKTQDDETTQHAMRVLADDRATHDALPALANDATVEDTDAIPAPVEDAPAEQAPQEEVASPPLEQDGESSAAAPETQETAPIQDTRPDKAIQNDGDAGLALDETATKLLLAETETTPAATETTPAEAPTPAAVPDQPTIECVMCKKNAAPYETLPDGRVRCGNCQAVFLPGRSRSPSPRFPTMPARHASKANPVKPKKQADDDDNPRLSGKQKIVMSLSTVTIVLVLGYFFFPSWGSSSDASAPVATKVSAEVLLLDFTTNATNANKKYTLGPVVVTGEVSDVFADKRPRIRFKGPGKRSSVEAVFAHVNDLKDIQKGTTITIRGECEGWQKNIVEITMSKLVATESSPQ